MSAERIGKQLEDVMLRQGLTVEELAVLAGKDVNNVEAVLAGYPNSTARRTPLDTVDEIAGKLGLRLTLTDESQELSSAMRRNA